MLVCADFSAYIYIFEFFYSLVHSHRGVLCVYCLKCLPCSRCCLCLWLEEKNHICQDVHSQRKFVSVRGDFCFFHSYSFQFLVVENCRFSRPLLQSLTKIIPFNRYGLVSFLLSLWIYVSETNKYGAAFFKVKTKFLCSGKVKTSWHRPEKNYAN